MLNTVDPLSVYELSLQWFFCYQLEDNILNFYVIHSLFMAIEYSYSGH